MRSNAGSGVSSPSTIAASCSSSRQRVSSSSSSASSRRRSTSSLSAISSAIERVRFRFASSLSMLSAPAGDAAGEVFGGAGGLDHARRIADAGLGRALVVAPGEDTTEHVLCGQTLEAVAAGVLAEAAARAAQLECDAGLGIGHDDELLRVAERDLGERLAASRAGEAAAPGGAAEVVPAGDPVERLAAPVEAGRDHRHDLDVLEPLVARAARGQLPAVAPPRFLGQPGAADLDELGRARPDQRDVVRLGEEPAVVAGQALQLLERLPALLNGREVPAAAGAADGPEPAPARVERDAAADREMLDRTFRAERGVTEHAASEHDRLLVPRPSGSCRCGSPSNTGRDGKSFARPE